MPTPPENPHRKRVNFLVLISIEAIAIVAVALVLAYAFCGDP
jgi:hypothetical protein